MNTFLEITGSAIRLCREHDRRLVALESYPVPPGADPLMALAAAPLPEALGRVTVILHHEDMLVRSMLQPPCSPERLDKLVRFEVANMAGDSSDPITISWHLVRALFPGASDDMRLLSLVTKHKLIAKLRQGLAAHGGKLAALIPPGIGLYHAYKSQEPDATGTAILADVGGKRLHLAFVSNGELVFLRTQTPGMDDLVKSVAERRGVSEADASKLVTKLGKGAPEDLREAIARQAGAIAATITSNLRFARTQIKVDQFEPTSIYISGAGAQVVGFVDTLRERTGLPVRLLNPFSGMLTTLPSEQLDRLSALPSPWAVAIGAAQTAQPELDALNDERNSRSLYWRTEGALRIAAVLAVSLLALTIVLREMTITRTGHALSALQGANNDGLVPHGDAIMAQIDQLRTNRAQSAQKIAWLDAQRRPGRVAIELLSAISTQQDPQSCPVVLNRYALSRQAHQVQVEIEGYATSVGKLGTDAILRNFEDGLRRRYPLIDSVVQLPKPISASNQPFHYRISIPDDATLTKTP
ncbi:MAG: pilus assembly protein PilM [Planctomycetes bacterium]|nr:pilus assembly protein PilM [Planctomycetota bacterium]